MFDVLCVTNRKLCSAEFMVQIERIDVYKRQTEKNGEKISVRLKRRAPVVAFDDFHAIGVIRDDEKGARRAVEQIHDDRVGKHSALGPAFWNRPNGKEENGKGQRRRKEVYTPAPKFGTGDIGEISGNRVGHGIPNCAEEIDKSGEPCTHAHDVGQIEYVQEADNRAAYGVCNFANAVKELLAQRKILFVVHDFSLYM